MIAWMAILIVGAGPMARAAEMESHWRLEGTGPTARLISTQPAAGNGDIRTQVSCPVNDSHPLRIVYRAAGADESEVLVVATLGTPDGLPIAGKRHRGGGWSWVDFPAAAPILTALATGDAPVVVHFVDADGGVTVSHAGFAAGLEALRQACTALM